ncbi:ATP-dependent protease La Type I [Mucinivorans hirudinis]|uniref:Lon protease n=1 Tax=Mucinivorans hirudinis TaxID=1433126 RepID=A0A060RAG5_9BACT|nr:ATP-dependent protease La Type I [Mucinivorans hirudinis]
MTFFETLENISDTIDGRHQIIPILSADDDDTQSISTTPEVLPILTLRSSVLFPGSITPITVGRDKSMRLVREIDAGGGLLGAVLQREQSVENPGPEDLYKVGTAARILKVLEMPNGNLTVILNGLEKFEIKEFISSDPYYKAAITILKDTMPKRGSVELDALLDSVKDVALKIIEISGTIPQEATFAIKNIDSRRGLINFISSNIDLPDADRQALLEAPGLVARARKLLEILIQHQQLIELKNEIQSKVKEDIDQQQREYYLHQQMRTIQEELGERSTGGDLAQMREKAKEKKWSTSVGELFEKEINKLDRMHPSMSDYSVQLNYLQLMLELPWGETTKDNLDLIRAKKQLDKDHFGLDDVKERILEHLAVLKLKGDLKSPIICLYGAPGVGKTSLGKSVAESLGRKFGRISLGGMHDEAEIRGHRKTYVGAMPGRIIQTIRRAASSNPVIILDEIDKVNSSNHGDPSSALLEVLDPEQNSTFHDNYLDVDYDLSQVLFIATANNISTISTALKDRMEMINVSGYLLEEKVEIATHHLIPKQLEAHGVKKSQLKISKKALEKIIGEYTRESGVRALDKLIAKITRYRAKQIGMEETYKADIKIDELEKILGVPRYRKDMQEDKAVVGVVTGLAWTEVGGEILYVESSLNKGKGNVIITGNLGEVMKESASIALGWVRANADKLGIDSEMFEKNDIHIHVPEGAIPKDGPSAGITMVTAIASVFTGRKVRSKIAMTGETTLRGKVLPVGGVKEKILAAKRAGVTDILLSKENLKDIKDIKEEYVTGLNFHYVANLDDVLNLALV